MTPTPRLALTHIGLAVAELGRSLAFYASQLGFVIVTRDKDRAELATSAKARAILTLHARPNATSRDTDAAGLFHAALLFPSRAGLGHWLQLANDAGVRFDGFSDHGVSEAIYLTDPDGNGLEFYADRPAETWPRAGGEIAMTTKPLDLESLLALDSRTNNGSGPLDAARWGHVHLRVTNLDRSEAFYRERLGLQVTQRSYPGARFMARDGYHHHVGLNVWGRPRRSQPPDALGLVEAAFQHPGFPAEEVSDPDGIPIRLAPVAPAS